jgi:hypothetical protein
MLRNQTTHSFLLNHSYNVLHTGNQLNDLVEFSWIETVLSHAWYEVLSILHMMAMISLLQANSLLIPRAPADGHQSKVSKEKTRRQQLACS